MALVMDILSCLEVYAPTRMAMDFDNVGLLCGFPDARVSRILCALDITKQVISEAEEFGAELIVSHHPLIFHAMKALREDDPTGRKLIRLVKGGRSAICMHTNLDMASGGVNDALAGTLGLRDLSLLSPCGTGPDGTAYGIGRIGSLPEPMETEAFLAHVKYALHNPCLRWVPGSGKPIRRVAVCGGSGGGELGDAIAAGCDSYVTADLKYDQLLTAAEAGILLVDADHFCTENVVVPRLKNVIEQRFPKLEIRISMINQAINTMNGSINKLQDEQQEMKADIKELQKEQQEMKAEQQEMKQSHS